MLPGVPETLMSGAMSGLRFARHSPAHRAIIVRNLSFAVCASGLWALLPVIARDQLSMGAGGFGLLSAAFGIGAVISALSVPRQLQKRSLAEVVGYGVGLWVLSIVVIAWTVWTWLAVLGAVGAGAAWMGHVVQPVGRHPEFGAVLGARPRGRDEPGRGAGEHRAGQRDLGRAGVGDQYQRVADDLGGGAGGAAPVEPALPCREWAARPTWCTA